MAWFKKSKQNEQVVTDTDGNVVAKPKKIVKLKKWKVFTIFFVVAAIIAGTTVGIYYAVVLSQPSRLLPEDNWNQVSTDEAESTIYNTVHRYEENTDYAVFNDTGTFVGYYYDGVLYTWSTADSDYKATADSNTGNSDLPDLPTTATFDDDGYGDGVNDIEQNQYLWYQGLPIQDFMDVDQDNSTTDNWAKTYEEGNIVDNPNTGKVDENGSPQNSYIETEIVLFIGAWDCPYCEFSIYGDGGTGTGEADTSEIAGPYGTYLESNPLFYQMQVMGSVASTQYLFTDIFLSNNVEGETPTINFVYDNVIYKITDASMQKEEDIDSIDTFGQYMIPVTWTYDVDPTGAREYVLTENGATGDSPFGSVPAWIYIKDGEVKFYTTGIITTSETTSDDGTTTTTEGVPTENYFFGLEEILDNGKYPI